MLIEIHHQYANKLRRGIINRKKHFKQTLIRKKK